MRLVDLDPHWLTFEGRRVGFIFRCPLPGKRDWWQTCFTEKFFLFKGRDGEYRYRHKAYSPDSQSGIVAKCVPEAKERFQGCNADHCWSILGGIDAADFKTISVSPSLDGSAGGLWHGHVTNGEIVGGL